MKICKLLICFLALFLQFAGYAQSWKKYPYAPAGSRISFPKDEGLHTAENSEWWYTTGHLTGSKTGTQYSYMLSYFHHPAAGFTGFRILNLSNDDAGQFYTETLPFSAVTLAEDSLNIKVNVLSRGAESWSNRIGADGRSVPFEYVISAASSSGSLQMNYVALKPPLILGDTGFFYEGVDSYTYYYSQTENAVTGSITLNGVTEAVTGTSWIDRQYGSFNPLSNNKYEWFSMQLSNGMDINTFNIFTADNKIPDTSTYRVFAAYVDTTHQFTTSHFNIDRSAFHFTTDSAMCYSQEWVVSVPEKKIDLRLKAVHHDYEVKLPFRFYEGTITVSGTVNGVSVTGVGFAELLHSYQKPSIALSQPPADASTPITWQLNNPDDARPLYYDLEYSLDSTHWQFIHALQDTTFLWNNVPSGPYYLRVIGFSIDTVLVSEQMKYSGSVTAVADARSTFNSMKLIQTEDGVLVVPASGESLTNFQLADMQGRMLPLETSKMAGGTLLKTTQLNPGMYVLQAEDGGQVNRCKFLVR